MHSNFWQTIADALFYLHLGWVFAGFGLMAYLSFKVFPNADGTREEKRSPVTGASEAKFQSIING